MPSRFCKAVLLLLTSLLPLRAQLPAPTMVVHEWGTFTALQDRNGDAIGAINVDDEPVPEFVHRVGRNAPATPATELTPAFESKALSPRHPDVTMRLETPVIYFYPANNLASKVTVKVEFHGGWLTEFYPEAKVHAPELLNPTSSKAPLKASTVGSLSWERLEVGLAGKGPKTEDVVWTTPREVASTSVRATNGEHEKFLFYRGVGHIDSPVRISSPSNRNEFRLTANPATFSGGLLQVPASWLVDIRANGTAAFRKLNAFNLNSGDPAPAAVIDAHFSEPEFTIAQLASLKIQMHSALVADGLFVDEARAMLKTWELSYFKSPGRRFFYIVPKAWTDAVLPLSISGKPQIVRVMMGRIELVTAKQEAALKLVANGPCPDIPALAQAYREKAASNQGSWWRLLRGERSFKDIGLAVPPVFQAYIELGRFKDALLLNELHKNPTEPLSEFVKANYLAD